MVHLPPQQLAGLAAEKGVAFDHLFLERMIAHHDGAVTKAWGARVFPTTFVIGPDQRIALVAIGDINWDAPSVEARIRAIAGKPGAVPQSRRAALVARIS